METTETLSRPPRADSLRQARIAAGLTQKAVVALTRSKRNGARIETSTLSKYETGIWPLTDERLAYLLGIIAKAVQS